MAAILARQNIRRLVAASAAVAALLCVLLIHSAPAKAEVFGFCGNVQLPGNGSCEAGSWVSTHQDYGWGDNHSVCVWLRPFNGGERCSGGPNQGVYSEQLSEDVVLRPVIVNNAAGANYVHGVYFTY